MPAFHHIPEERLVLDEMDFKLGEWNDKRVIDTEFKVPKEVQHNHTLWAHIYIALHGYELDPTAPSYNVRTAYHFFRPLNQFLAKKKVRRTRKLIGGEETDEEIPDEPVSKGPVIASYYHPNFTMSMVPDSSTLKWSTVHPAVRQYIVLEATGARDESGQNGWYYPIMFVNTFWQLRDHMMELNSTVKTLPLHIDLSNLNNWKFGIYATLDESIKTNQRNIANGGPVPAGGDGSEFEEFKRILIDTNIYLLSTTAVVTVLHTIFEFLAFKNDVVSTFIPSAFSDLFESETPQRYGRTLSSLLALTSFTPSSPSFHLRFSSLCLLLKPSHAHTASSRTGAKRKTTSASQCGRSSRTSACNPSSSCTC